MKAPFIPIKAVKRLSIIAVVVACFASTNVLAQSTDDWNWEHPLPSFGPEISLDKGLGIVYTKLSNNSIRGIDAFNILAGRTRFLKLDSDIGIGDLLPAMECDGGYALTEDKSQFVGLSLDDENQYDETESRIEAWCEQLLVDMA